MMGSCISLSAKSHLVLPCPTLSYLAPPCPTLFSSHFVRGVGGESGESVRVEMVDLPWLEMAGGVRFDNVSVEYISIRVSGIVHTPEQCINFYPQGQQKLFTCNS